MGQRRRTGEYRADEHQTTDDYAGRNSDRWLRRHVI
jgi:hypothetical protein